MHHTDLLLQKLKLDISIIVIHWTAFDDWRFVTDKLTEWLTNAIGLVIIMHGQLRIKQSAHVEQK